MKQIPQKFPVSSESGEVRSLMLRQDWSLSPIGHPQTWPQELLTVVDLILESRFPMFVAWGAELGLIYNDKYAELMGKKHPSGFGRRFKDVWEEIWHDLTPMVEGALAGKSSYLEDLPLTVRRNGDFEQAWFTFSYSPVRDSEGVIAGIYCAVVETTSRILNEKRQAFQLELADRLRPLNLPEEIIATSSALFGRHMDVCRTFYAEIDDHNKTFRVLGSWHAKDMVAFPEAGQIDDFGPMLVGILRSGSAFVVDDVTADERISEHTASYAALQTRSLLIIPLVKSGRLAATLNLSKSNPYHWTKEDVIHAKDISERIWSALQKARTQVELREADRRKDEFLAMLAHELRNPLAPISAAASLIGLGNFDAARLKQTSQVIIRQVRHMTGLVDDLLDVSRVTRGLVSISKSPQDLKVIVSNAVEQVQPLMESFRHQLVIDLAPECVQVLGEQKRLVQLLTNLLNNAAKYTRPGGRIYLQMDARTDHVLLSVQDNGIGIAPELQPRVFDLFIQAERTSDRSQGGLGLGLALVKSLATLHGGTVSCVSDGIDKGSRFTVCLPRLHTHQATGAERQDDTELQKPRKALRLMVVDDNKDAAAMLAMLLEALGHHVLLEHDPFHALERARVEQPDVFLLDIGLPGMDGNELALRLRAQHETAQAVLIAVTGYGQENDRKAAIASGFSYFLTKPVDMPKLTDLLAGMRIF